ncbi:hypothetical protein EGR_10929 [Echinococcus granulosus]|uniref:Uncharacterized protein n=1 Tax=Echinococcus granulosus TaxID=6210 RepID=W6U157_ECHGR|nr:hypothetical protein EGR_10929 [Echinococcus granulosus]EUB54211.1 hypothetical protein EGR_10929 [Echinococcus granulosus]
MPSTTYRTSAPCRSSHHPLHRLRPPATSFRPRRRSPSHPPLPPPTSPSPSPRHP